MSDYKTVKKKQHYVYRAYLAQWHEKNCEIHTLDLNIFEIFTKKHARETGEERLFYKTKVDDIVYDMIVYKYHDLIKNKSKNNPIYGFITALKTLTKVTKYQDNQLENYDKLDIIHNNFLENYYNDEIETLIDPVLKKFMNLKNQNYQNFLTPKDYHQLILFIVSQTFRTKSSLDNMTQIFKDLFIKYPDKEIQLTETQVSSFHKLCAVIDIWKYTEKMIKDRVNLEIYHNLTDLDFITSDQPVFIKKIKEDKFLYYFNFPLTPKFFIKVLPNKSPIPKDPYSFKTIKDRSKIIKINYTIYSNAYSYAYSNDRNNLEKYKIFKKAL
ncbi:DUF4238 domain-containing protein [Acinetobacter sp.]|uniref:DUF4238 domain-containing protein n=1 Tax=Acinetobacter sp. TaxID=472 RepID=UPI0025846191|nr:DUF4238 domain-containing protein [Acinetobacter sp.]